MAERRLGRGWNAARRRCWCDDGRISAASARFTKSPSTVPIRTTELVIADRRALSRFDGDETEEWPQPPPLWRLQRKEPGWVVGEHMQVLRGEAEAAEIELRLAAMRLTRAGGAVRWWWRKLEVKEGEGEKAEEEFLRPPAPENKRPAGKLEREKPPDSCIIGPLDLALGDAAIGIARERK